MSPGGRGTRTGKTHEKMLEQALIDNYNSKFVSQTAVGKELFGKKYIADFVLKEEIIISAKWQQTRGTAEQKIVYDILSLIKIIKENPKYKKAYIVLGGTGFSAAAKEFFLGQAHLNFVKDGEKVEVISLEKFIEKANSKIL